LAINDIAGITDTQRYLHRQFHMKDLGHLRYFLGLAIVQAERGILIHRKNKHMIFLMLLHL